MKLLEKAVERGNEEDLDAWAGTGRAGLVTLRDILTRKKAPAWRDLHPRDAIDGLTTAVAKIAWSHPDEFLDIFADRKFDVHGFVLVGLGYIDRPEATKRLADAALSGNDWTIRLDAAHGLAWRASPVAVGALVVLLGDSEYLVRHQALQGLIGVGDRTALAPLRAFVAQSEIERQMTERAIAAIESRGEESR